jgi:hypothetical protein
MKMFWFFTATSEIPWTFKLCGIFQMCCDLYLGVQYWQYGDGEKVIKDHDMEMRIPMPSGGAHLHGRRTPIVEKNGMLD